VVKLEKIKRVDRRSFSKLKSDPEMPNLLEVQLKSYQEFLQIDVDAWKEI
jgi:DNA-directed RNA polymerase beta subunit